MAIRIIRSKKKKWKLSSAEELAYFAGYFDADGCVTGLNHKSKRLIEFKITVVSAVRERLEEFKEAFGGSIVTMHRSGDQHHPGGAKSTRDTYQWCSSYKASDRCLSALLPYLRTKRSRAETYLKARSTFPSNRGPRDSRSRSEETWEARAALLGCIRDLNHM